MAVRKLSKAVERADARLKQRENAANAPLEAQPAPVEAPVKSAPVAPSELSLYSTKEMKDHRRKQVEELVKNSPPQITPNQWGKFLDLVTQGVNTGPALEQVSIPKYHFDRAVRLEPKLFQQWMDARSASQWAHWDQDVLDDILAKIMDGTSTKDACAAHEKTPSELYRLAMVDPVVKQQYDDARKIQAEAMLDDIQVAAEDATNDFTVEGKGNAAAVNRSRLIVETMQYRMEKMHAMRFGPQRKVEHTGTVNVDHVHLLEEGRRRVENIKRPVTVSQRPGLHKPSLPDPHRVAPPSG